MPCRGTLISCLDLHCYLLDCGLTLLGLLKSVLAKSATLPTLCVSNWLLSRRINVTTHPRFSALSGPGMIDA